MRVHGNAVRELLRAQLSFMWQLLSSPSHTGWAHGGGARHYLNPAHIDPAACRNMPMKDKCSGGRRKGLSSRNFAVKKVSVKEMKVLYFTGYMKSLSSMHHLFYSSLEPSGFWSLNMVLMLHYLGTA